MNTAFRLLALAAASTLSFSCGDDDDDGVDGVDGDGVTVSGTVIKGPVSGATVTGFAVENGVLGAEVGTATTGADGSFTMDLGDHSGPIVMQANGGTYRDEATGDTMDMLEDDSLSCALPSVDEGTSAIVITPLTSMAQLRAHAMTGGLTADNIMAANDSVGGYFGVGDIVHTMPMDPLQEDAGAGATPDERNAGMVMAAMSQYATSIGMMTSSSGMVTALSWDASDGTMDGMMGSTPISMSGMGGMMGGTMSSSAGTADLAGAMTDFVESPMNASGVTVEDMQELMDRLMGSDGTLPGDGGN